MGSAARCLRARRSVSRPEMPGMRTSEIIIAMSSVRSTSSARSPEGATMVSKPWLFRNESRRLRWPGSSSTIRIRGFSAVGIFTAEALRWRLRSGSRFRSDFQMCNPQDSTFGFVWQTLNFPPVGRNDLLHDCQPKAGAGLSHGDVGLEDLSAVFGRNAGPIITNIECSGTVPAVSQDLNRAIRLNRLDRVEHQVKERLAQELFVRLD